MSTTLRRSYAFSVARCAAPKCGRSLAVGAEVFMDLLSEHTYCKPCGVSLRFHRKRAEARGEAAPVTYNDVEERFQTR